MGNICTKKQVIRSLFCDRLSQDLQKDYEILEKVGTTDMDSVIQKVRHKSSEQIYLADTYAVKLEEDLTLCETVHKAYQIIDHPKLPKLQDIYRNNKSDEQSITFIRTLCEGGELFDRLIELGSIQQNQAAKYTHQLLEAVKHLHDNGIVHRNLKPETIYFIDKNHSKLMIHLSIFVTEPGETENLTLPCGTPGYVSPEVLDRQVYGKETDLWSLGVITYIMLCGYPPFSNSSLTELYKQIISMQHSFGSPEWDSVSSDAKDFVDKLLKKNPKKRMTSAQALLHPWMTTTIVL